MESPGPRSEAQRCANARECSVSARKGPRRYRYDTYRERVERASPIVAQQPPSSVNVCRIIRRCKAKCRNRAGLTHLASKGTAKQRNIPICPPETRFMGGWIRMFASNHVHPVDSVLHLLHWGPARFEE